MKKILLLSFIVVLLMTGMTGCFAMPTESSAAPLTITMQIGNPMMTVNGIEREIDPGIGTVPVLQQDRTLLPVRAVVEELGGVVHWDEEVRSVVLALGDDVILLTIDSTVAYFNEEINLLDVPPIILQDRTMLPIRFVAESFGLTVIWNESNSTITLTQTTDQNGQPTKSPPPQEEEPTARTLVVYFSRSGNTQTLAQTVHAVTGGDLAEIVPVNPYPEDYNECLRRAQEEQRTDARPEITVAVADMARVDTIVLGYPIWFGTLPPPVVSFLSSYDLSGKTIMPFCTSGSSGIATSLPKIRELCPESTVTDGLRGTSATDASEIRSWLDKNGFDSTGR